MTGPSRSPGECEAEVSRSLWAAGGQWLQGTRVALEQCSGHLKMESFIVTSYIYLKIYLEKKRRQLKVHIIHTSIFHWGVRRSSRSYHTPWWLQGRTTL